MLQMLKCATLQVGGCRELRSGGGWGLWHLYLDSELEGKIGARTGRPRKPQAVGFNFSYLFACTLAHSFFFNLIS